MSLIHPRIPFLTTKSLVLTGGDYVSLGNVLDYTSGTARSWTGYVYLSSLKVQAFVSKRDGTGNGFLFYTAANGAVYLYIQGSTGTLQVRTPLSAVSAGSWFHLAVTKSTSDADTGVNIYINGSNQTLTTLSSPMTGTATTTADMRYGSHKNNSFDFDGRMHRGAFWSKQLSSTEVTEDQGIKTVGGLFTHTAASNLIAYHRFGNDPLDGTSAIYDRAGAYTGTPSGIVAGDFVTDAP